MFLKMLTSNTITRAIRSPFTTTQWQELEHQVLIFKYIVSGVPIPPDLIYSVKRSLDSALSSRFFPHNPPSAVGWGCFEMGFGRKVDPEPGRCRRTDGKKWRCSKETHPDSKYCEKHKHRGRNRSRKPVEVSSTSTSSTITNPSLSFSSINKDFSSTSSTISSYSSLSSSSMTPEPYMQHSCPIYPFIYPHSGSYGPPYYGLSSINNTTPYFSPKSEPCNQADHEDYSSLSGKRNFQGIKESEDDEAFFPESSENASHPLLSSYRDYSQQQYQGIRDNSKDSRQSDEQHCFILGTDIKSPKLVKTGKEPETQKHLHHFFGEWPPKKTDSWLDLASNSRVRNDG